MKILPIVMLTILISATQAAAAEKLEFTCIANWIGGVDCSISGRCEHHESDAKLVEDATWVASFNPTGGNLKRFGGDSKLTRLFNADGFEYFRVHDRVLGKNDILVWHPRQRKLFFASFSDRSEKLSTSNFALSCVLK